MDYRVFVPKFCDTFYENHLGETYYYIKFPDDSTHALFCETSNIGYHEMANPFVHKGDRVVYSTKKELLIGFDS